MDSNGGRGRENQPQNRLILNQGRLKAAGETGNCLEPLLVVCLEISGRKPGKLLHTTAHRKTALPSNCADAKC